MAMFASLSHIQHHTRGVCLLFDLHHTNGSVCLCVLYSTSHKTAVLTFSFQFQNHTLIGCNLASTCAAWILKKRVKIKQIFNLLNVPCSKHFVPHTQYHTSTISNQIRQDGWAFCPDINFTGGLMSDGPMSGRHQEESQPCSLFCSLCISKCTHHTNSHVSSAGCSQSSNPPEVHAPISTPSPPPLLLISLTSYSWTTLLDHSIPVPTPASRNSHSVDAR